MYQVRALQLTKDDLWSNGVIQKVYLDDAETALLFCLGVTRGDRWEPLCIEGKVGYAYRSEADAQEICARQLCSKPASSIGCQQVKKIAPGRVAIGLLLAVWGNLF